MEKQPGTRVFYFYVPADSEWRNRLAVHLSQLRHNGLIEEWSNQQILPGSETAQAIDQAISAAHVILLLISADFLASDMYAQTEMQQALERHERHEICVIPIILKPCDWRHSSLKNLPYLPRNGVPVTQWRNREAAFLDITNGLRNVLQYPPQGIPNSQRRRAYSLQRRPLIHLIVAAIAATTAVVSGLALLVRPWNWFSSPHVPTLAPSKTSSQSPIVTSTSVSPVGTPLPYVASWTTGLNGWRPALDPGQPFWYANEGMLLCNGNLLAVVDLSVIILAPLVPDTANYAVETRIQFVKTMGSDPAYFGIILREPPNTLPYMVGIDYRGQVAVFYTYKQGNAIEKPYQVDTQWHVYRAEAKGNSFSLFVDNQHIFTHTDLDNLHPDPGQVGLISSACQLRVSSFKVTAL